MVHYGGDQGESQFYRNRTLSFYENTLIVTADVANSYKMGIFEPDVSTATVALSNNILLFTPHTPGASAPELDIAANNNGSPTGTFALLANWISPGWKICFGGGSCLAGSVSGTQNVVSPANNSPGFTSLTGENYTLAAGSDAIGAASSLPSLITSNPQAGNFTPVLQYLPDLKTVRRSSLNDLGGFAALSQACCYSVNPGSPSFTSAASTSSLTPAAGSTCSWAESSSASGLSATPSSGSGNAASQRYCPGEHHLVAPVSGTDGSDLTTSR
jgi:hypothetical protein